MACIKFSVSFLKVRINILSNIGICSPEGVEVTFFLVAQESAALFIESLVRGLLFL